jgi:hypothetical protein
MHKSKGSLFSLQEQGAARDWESTSIFKVHTKKPALHKTSF